MANNLGILEVTLAQLADSTHAINVVGTASGNARLAHWDVAVVRVTNHDDDDNAEQDDATKMALFKSRAHMYPWKKDTGAKHIVEHGHPTDIPNNLPSTDVTVLYPNFDYSTSL